MLTHQSIAEEVEMMQFLIDEEQGCGYHQQAANLKKFEDVDRMLEQALDGLHFEKFLSLTRMQALNSSIARCRERTKERSASDHQLAVYAEWLEEKQRAAQQYEQAIRMEVKQLEKVIGQKMGVIATQMKKPVGSRTRT